LLKSEKIDTMIVHLCNVLIGWKQLFDEQMKKRTICNIKFIVI